MTIRSNIDARALSERLDAIETVARTSGDGEYPEAKRVASLVEDAAMNLRMMIESMGAVAPSNDAAREVEALIYGYLLASNPHLEPILAAAEMAGREASA